MADFSPEDIDFEACEIGARALSILQEHLRAPQNRKKISSLTNIPEKTLTDYFNGRTSPPLDRFLLIALACGLRPAEFFEASAKPAPLIGDPPQIIMIPHLDIEVAAGAGSFVDVVVSEDSFPFPWPFLRRLLGDAAISARLETLRAKGRSMEPTIADGALLMLDRSQNTLPPVLKNGQKRRPVPEPDVYVFAHNGDIRLKRLQRLNDDFIAIHSDNRAEFPPEVFDLNRDGSFKVIGKVIWWDNRL
jgi:phage repressor protein C with HTH and peptisase S24 domain